MTTQASRAPTRMTKSEIAGTIVILVIASVCLLLFSWQLERRQERRSANAGIAARMTSAPLPGFEALADTSGSLYKRMQQRGTFDYARGILLPGRSMFGSPGVHLLTPLLIADSMAILVNRGWLPSPDAATVDISRVPDEQSDTIIGLVLSFPGRNASVARNADTLASSQMHGDFRRVWYTIDEKQLRAQFPYRLAPFVLQILPANSDAPFPKRIDPPALDEGPHLSYAIQWFSFAVIAIVGWITFVVRRRGERGGKPAVQAPPHPPSF